MTRLGQPTITARHLMIALNEAFPDSAYGAIPVIDQTNALHTHFEYTNGEPAINTEIAFPLVTVVAK